LHDRQLVHLHGAGNRSPTRYGGGARASGPHRMSWPTHQSESGELMRGGNFSCEAETSHVRRGLVVQGGDSLERIPLWGTGRRCCQLVGSVSSCLGMAAGRVCAGIVFARPKAYPHPQLLPARWPARGQKSLPLPVPDGYPRVRAKPATQESRPLNPLWSAPRRRRAWRRWRLRRRPVDATPAWVDAPSAQTVAAYRW
jgi:hypothetical protein